MFARIILMDYGRRCSRRQTSSYQRQRQRTSTAETMVAV